MKLAYKKNTGQAVIEMALILPLLIMLALGSIEFGIIFVKSCRLTSAVRDGARVVAMGMQKDLVCKRALNTSGLDKNLCSFKVIFPNGNKPGDLVSIKGTYNHSPLTPILGQKSFPLDFTVNMSIESN